MLTTVATCAFPPTYDIEESLARHLMYIDEAADAGADLVVFPEASLQAIPPDVRSIEIEQVLLDLYDRAEPVPDGPSVLAIADKANERGIHVIYGLTEASASRGVVYNTAVLTGPDGHIGSFRKVHVGVGEKFFWRRGDDWPVFETPFGRIGMLICWDKGFPESTRELTLRGADLLVMPTAWGVTPGHGTGLDNLCARQYELYDRARAAENGRWFVSSNFLGELGGQDFFGMSQIVDPLGDIVATSGNERVGLTIATIDVQGGIAAARAATQGAFLIRDRRPETYRAMNGEIPTVVDG